MRLIVAGGRNITDYRFVRTKLNKILSTVKDTIEIVSGCCDTGKLTHTRPDGTIVCGVDGLGERYAEEHGHNVVYFRADWVKYGKSAGPIRNRQMAPYCTHSVVIWDGKSTGSGDMIKAMKELPEQKPLREIIYTPQ